MPRLVLDQPVKPRLVPDTPRLILDEPMGFWQKTKAAWDIGGRGTDLEFQWRGVKYGTMTRTQAERNEAEFHKKLKENPLEARNWLENIYLKTVSIAHPMASGQAKGLTYGTIGAGMGAMVIPGPDPLDIVTAPSGFAIGNIVGAYSYWAEQGEGSIYREAIKAGLSHKTASTVSSIGGPIYGAIEFSQVDKLIPKLGGFAKKTVLSAIVGYLKRIGVEVLEEGEQKIVTEGAVNLLGKALEEKLAAADVPGEVKKMGIAALGEMKEAVGPMTLLTLPGGSIDVGRAMMAKPKPAISPQRVVRLVEEPIAAPPMAVTPAEGVKVPLKPITPVKPVPITTKVAPATEIPPTKPPLVAKEVPEKVEGLTKAELDIVSTETAKQLRGAQLEGAKIGYKVGEKSTRTELRARIEQLKAEKQISKTTRKEAVKILRDTFGKNIPKKLVTLLSKTTEKKHFDKIMSIVPDILEKVEQKQAVKELKLLSKKIKPRIGKTMQEKGIRPEYAKKLNTLVDSFATRKLSQWRIKDIGSLKNYLLNLKEGISNDPSMDDVYRAKLAEMLIPQRRLGQLEKLSKSSIHLLKAEDIRTITAELQRLVHLNDVKNKLYLGRTARRTADYLKQAIKEQKAVKDESRLVKEPTLTATRQPKGVLRTAGRFIAGADNHDMKTLAFTIEGGKEGVIAATFGEGFRYGRRAENTHKVGTLNYTRKFLADNNISQSDLIKLSPLYARAFRTEKGQKIRKLFARETPTYKVKIAGRDINLTMAEMMSVYMHAQADFNTKAMLREGVASVLDEIGTLMPEELATIINHVKANPKALALTKLYAHIAETINKPAINKVSMDLKGIEIADVENYFTVERFTRGKVAGNQEYQINLLESQGFLQERTGSKNPIVIRDFFAVLMGNVDGVSEYVGMAKPFRAAHTLLSYKNWAKAVDGKGHELQRRHLNALMEHTEQKPKVKGRMESLFGYVLRGVPRAVLAEPGIMAGQIMSEINYHATDIPSKYLLLTHPVPTKAEVERATNEFPWMWVRRNLGAASIATRNISRTDAALRAFTGKKALINLPTQGINYVDMKAITYGRKAVEKWVAGTTNLKGQEFIDEVNKRTHKAVSESQPMFETENRSILTSNPNVLAKVFFLFRSYIDQTLRIMSRARTAYRNGLISKSAMASKFGIVLAGFAAYKMLRILVNRLIYNRKKDPYEVARDVLLSPMRALTVVGYPAERQISRMMDIFVGRKPKTRYFDVGFENLVTSTINEIWESVRDYGDAAAYLGTDEVYKSGKNKGRLKSEVLMWRATEKLAYSLGRLVGLPTPAMRRFRYGWLKKEAKKKPKTIFKSTKRKSIFKKAKRKSIFRKAG